MSIDPIAKLKQKIPLFQARGFRKYLTNTLWLLIESLFRIVLSFFVGVYVARYLGPERLGVLSYSQSFVGLFFALANLGLDEIVVRELIAQKEDKNIVLGTSFLLKMFGAVVTFLVITFILLFMDHEPATDICIYFYTGAFLFIPIQIINFYFRAIVQSKSTVLVKFSQLTLSALLKVSFVLLDVNLIWFAFVVIVEGVISLIGLIIVFHAHQESVFRWRFKMNLAKHLLSDSWLLVLSGIAISIYLKIDQVMIKNLLNVETVGNYAVAVKLTEIWYFAPAVITSSLFPSILKAKQFSLDHYHNRLQKLYDLITWLAIGIALPISLFSNWIVKFIYGAEYESAGNILTIYIWAGVFIFSNIATQKWYLAENLEKHIFYRSFSGAFLNIGLNWILIKIYGATGAAMATMISIAFVSYLSMAMFPTTFHNFIMVTKSLNPFAVLIRLRQIEK